jgi:two-component system, cell cycle response regulator DivK
MIKILYVEDNHDNIYMLERRLKRRGYDVLIAQDGETGLIMAAAELPHLILMDLDLPGIDGWEATRQLKSTHTTAHIPVIALSAHAMAEHRTRALEAGCDDVATKPVDFADLIAKIESYTIPETS